MNIDMDKDNIKIEMEENNKHIEHIEPEIIDAIEHVPCCRKCCDEFIRNHDDSEQRCRECCRECCIRNNENIEKCHKKWIECGKIEDEKCIRCCRLNFGELLQSRCPKPCFECCNDWCHSTLTIFIFMFGTLTTMILIFLHFLAKIY
jgi:hypothetical protein